MPTRRDTLAGLGAVAVTGLAGCGGTRVPVSVEILDVAAEALFRGAQDLEQLADGFVWSEGPTWDRMRQCLYFTDVPSNRAYRWSAAAGLETFLDPSGTDPAQAEGMREAGANGLWFGEDGQLYLCNHGERAVQRLQLESLER